MNLGEITNQLLELERLESGKPQQCVAKNMLVFMVRSLFSKLEYPYAQFPCSSLSADLIFPLVWDCIKRLESCGFKVVALTADGASCNRKFFKMHGAGGSLVYKTNNPFSPEGRKIYFFSDVPHLIKTVRNCWSNSFGHNMTRVLEVNGSSCIIISDSCKYMHAYIMQINGQQISWQHLVDLYHRHRGTGDVPVSGLSMLKKIKYEHIQLTSYSKMRVDLAAQVRSYALSVAMSLMCVCRCLATQFLKH